MLSSANHVVTIAVVSLPFQFFFRVHISFSSHTPQTTPAQPGTLILSPWRAPRPAAECSWSWVLSLQILYRAPD